MFVDGDDDGVVVEDEAVSKGFKKEWLMTI
jgi:hypothetical protein